MRKVRKRVVTGYMDKVDFDEELGNAIDGNKVFPSLKALKKYKPCTKQCGIVKVEVRLKEVIRETDFSESIRKARRQGNPRIVLSPHVQDKLRRTAQPSPRPGTGSGGKPSSPNRI